MATKQFVFDAFKTHMASKEIDLTTDVIKVALCTTFAPTYSIWVASTVYSEGDIVTPITRNGRRYRCSVAGTTDSSEPTWPSTTSDTVVDNTATWEEYGGEHCNIEFWDTIDGNEVATGSGYTTGGIAVANQAVAAPATDPIETQFDFDDLTWTALTKTFRVGVVYIVGATPSTDDYLVSYILFDDTPGDIVLAGLDFALRINTSGLIGLV